MFSYCKNTKNMDLAMEAKEVLQGKSNIEINGIKETVKYHTNAKITEIEILNETGAKAMGRGMGKYITIEIPELPAYNKASAVNDIVKVTHTALKRLINIKEKQKILIVGLGNQAITPDSLGPQVIAKIQPTYHVYGKFAENLQKRISSVMLFTPGVLGNTGISTFNTIESVVKKQQPDSVIIIDALATTSIKRICNTIQLTNTGIRPGSGILGNNRKIDGFNMKIPVTAIGIPTIMHAGTIINEAIETCLSNPKISFNTTDENIILNTAEQLLQPYTGNLMVSPKDIDTMIPVSADIIAKAIVKTVHHGLKENEYQDFMQ